VASRDHFTCLLVLPKCEKHNKPRIINFDPLHLGEDLQPYQEKTILSTQKTLKFELYDIKQTTGKEDVVNRNFAIVEINPSLLGYPVHPKSDGNNCGAYVCLYATHLIRKIRSGVLKI